MHQYLLYVKQTDDTGWAAYVTPCFAVDRQYWEECDGGPLHLVGKCRSLALAFAVREEIGKWLALHPSPSVAVGQIRQRAFRFVQELNRAYWRKLRQQRERFGGVAGSVADELGERVASGDGPYRFDPIFAADDADTDPLAVDLPQPAKAAMTQQLLPLLAGRALLVHEVEALLRANGSAFSPQLLPALQLLVLRGCTRLLPAIRLIWRVSRWRHQLHFICERCGADERDGAVRLTFCHTCGQGCAYCLLCLQMGRCKCCTPLVQTEGVEAASVCSALSKSSEVASERFVSGGTTSGGAAPIGAVAAGAAQEGSVTPEITPRCAAMRAPAPSLLHWNGSYSPLQAQAAERARRFVAQPSSARRTRDAATPAVGAIPAFLIWAVCGAGKTELVFPAIDETLRYGGRVLLATPRKDVVLELLPRLQAVFPTVKVTAVYGGSPAKWEDAALTLATTHQVLRFYRRFALVIVDEVDAFPYHGDPVLQRAVLRAVGRGGKLLYLTATPPPDLRDRLVVSGQSPGSVSSCRVNAARFFHKCSSRAVRLSLASPTHVMVPQRYHGHPLPVPRSVLISGLQRKLRANRNIPLLIRTIRQSLERGRQVFVFVARVTQTARVLAYLRGRLPEQAAWMEAVSAADPEREEKVRRFRERTLRLLVTTTILERGVTIPHSDVIVLEADDPVFDEAALVQIAGRVGRSADDPVGTVLFLLNRRSRSPYAAIRQIRAMNRLAAEVRGAVGIDWSIATQQKVGSRRVVQRCDP